jgi:hypothetical protein
LLKNIIRTQGKLVPTCYSLHVAPQLLRTVQVYSGVDKKIRGGAHVFIPGVVRPANLSELALELGDQWPAAVFSGRWEKGDLCAVLGKGVSHISIQCSFILQQQ